MNHLDCYRILDIEPGCDWDGLRAAYRRQVQKWHPDRYQLEPDHQARAVQRIQQINQAFEQLSDYYAAHGRLPEPPREPDRPAAAPPHPAPEAGTPAPDAAADIYKAFQEQADIFTPLPNRHSARNTGLWISVLLVVIIGSVFFSHIDLMPRERYTAMPQGVKEIPLVPEAGSAPESGHDYATVIKPTDAPAPKVSVKPKKITSTFTYGATPGEVFAAQGVPTRTVGDIWYYGLSEVHFNKGQVTRWHSAPSDPLNVQADATPAPPKSSKPTSAIDDSIDKKKAW